MKAILNCAAVGLLFSFAQTAIAEEATSKKNTEPTVVSADSCDGAITLKNVCWKMSPAEIRQTLSDDGYTCANLGNFSTCRGNDSNILLIERVGSQSVSTMYFSCEQFNACGLSVRDYAQALVSNGIVTSMNYEGNNRLGERYCGLGPAQDKVCVMAQNDIVRAWHQLTYNFFKKNIVSIEKGALGSGGVKFN